MLAAKPSNASFKTRKAQRGQGMTEYLIIVALIAVAAIGVFRLFGDTLRQQMSGLAQELSGQSGAQQTTAAQNSANSAANEANTQKDLSNYSAGNQTGGGEGGGNGGGGQ